MHSMPVHVLAVLQAATVLRMEQFVLAVLQERMAPPWELLVVLRAARQGHTVLQLEHLMTAHV